MAEEIQTQATADDSIGTINTEEELLALLNGDGDNDPPADPDSNDSPEDPNNLLPPAEPNDPKSPADPNPDPNNPPADPNAEKEFDNMVQFFNDKYKLELNMGELPEDLDRAQEAEIISGLYDRILQDRDNKLQNYQRIEEILKDKEVASFLEAKRNGKTMKDFVVEYGGEVAGKTDEEIVKASLKQQYPGTSDEDIQDMVDGLKERNKLETAANAAREKAIKDNEASREQKEKDERAQLERDQKARQEDVANFKTMVGKIDKVYGVPVDKSMRDQLIVAATQSDENGLTYLDKALQSEQGVLLATMGILHMERLIKAGQTTNKNRARNDIIERLTADPNELQSSSNVQTSDEFNVDAANSF